MYSSYIYVKRINGFVEGKTAYLPEQQNMYMSHVQNTWQKIYPIQKVTI